MPIVTATLVHILFVSFFKNDGCCRMLHTLISSVNSTELADIVNLSLLWIAKPIETWTFHIVGVSALMRWKFRFVVKTRRYTSLGSCDVMLRFFCLQRNERSTTSEGLIGDSFGGCVTRFAWLRSQSYRSTQALLWTEVAKCRSQWLILEMSM